MRVAMTRKLIRWLEVDFKNVSIVHMPYMCTSMPVVFSIMKRIYCMHALDIDSIDILYRVCDTL